jgi:hypothetical protein
MASMDTIYFIRATKDYSKDDVRTLLCRQFGEDSIDRLLSIDALEMNKRVFVVAFWRVPSVNLFHDSYKEPLSLDLPWNVERIDPYLIFKDGHYPAPHFLRNSKNLTNEELDELGIGGAGEFIYINLSGSDNHWEMFRDGTYYMPDMTYYNKPHMEPLTVVDRPTEYMSSFNTLVDKKLERWSQFILVEKESWPKDLTEEERTLLEEELKDKRVMAPNSFNRWRDFYLEYPKTWPKDLSEDERMCLEKQYKMIHSASPSPWRPECGRDPTNMAEQQERLESESYEEEKQERQEREELYEPDPTFAYEICRPSLERSISCAPTRELNSSLLTPFPSQERTFSVDNQLLCGKYKWDYREFD